MTMPDEAQEAHGDLETPVPDSSSSTSWSLPTSSVSRHSTMASSSVEKCTTMSSAQQDVILGQLQAISSSISKFLG